MSFHKETSVVVAKCQLFSQANPIKESDLLYQNLHVAVYRIRSVGRVEYFSIHSITF